ncbi:MAG: hypothetical protein JWN30_2798 [Bacilli bacterium]|nr:hypothetical protein [Bacilli bacterium]
MTVFMWFVNALLVSAIAFLFMRVMGIRAMSEMSPHDFIYVSIVGGMLAHALSDQHQLLQIAASAAFVVLIYWALSVVMLKNSIRRFLHLKPTVLISKGLVNEEGLRKVRMTLPELVGHLRAKGFASMADVEFAILEETGSMSVIGKSELDKLTPRDMHIQKAQVTLPVPVVIEGKWIEDSLTYLGKDQRWILQKLAEYGFSPKDLHKLMYVQVEADETLTIDKKDSAKKQNSFPNHI